MLLDQLGLRQPESRSATSREQALACARELGYPVLVRPSYVLGGRGMRVVYEPSELEDWLTREALVSASEPVLLDRFLEGALEVDVDAVADGETVLVGAVMEHIEEAGIHSGDSTCVIPPFTLGEHTLRTSSRDHRQLARALGVRGLLNVQFAVRNDQVYVLEANPRASRTVPFVSKAVGLPLARLAARVMAGERLADIAPAEAPPTPHGERQEAGAAVRPLPGRGRAARPRDEVHRRGHGPRPRLRPGAGQGAPGLGRAASRQRHGVPQPPRRRQAGHHVHGEETGRTGVWTGGDPRHGPVPGAATAYPAARCSRCTRAGRTWWT